MYNKKACAKYYKKNRKIKIKKVIIYNKLRYNTDKKYKEKEKIRSLSNHKYGKRKKECIICGTNRDLQLHHYSDSPQIDEVICVCFLCHGDIHLKENAKATEV